LILDFGLCALVFVRKKEIRFFHSHEQRSKTQDQSPN